MYTMPSRYVVNFLRFRLFLYEYSQGAEEYTPGPPGMLPALFKLFLPCTDEGSVWENWNVYVDWSGYMKSHAVDCINSFVLYVLQNSCFPKPRKY